MGEVVEYLGEVGGGGGERETESETEGQKEFHTQTDWY